MDLSIEIHSDRRWSYANAGTRRPLVKRIILSQAGALPDRDIKIVPRVTLDFPLPEPVAEVWASATPRTLERNGDHIGETIEWERIDLRLNYPLLGRLQEKVRGVIRVEIVDVEDGDRVLAAAVQELELLAPNEFRQEVDYMDVIAAFVLPTDPFVLEIMLKTRELLLERTGDSSTQGYQGGPIRARSIANAVYDAMSSMGYDYSNPQGYFEAGAQRVRTPSQIKQENCATCLDSAALMAACFAQAGLEPVVFMIKGHAYSGYFTGRELVQDGPAGDEAVSHWLRALRRNRITQLLRSRHFGDIQHLLREGHIQPVETTTTTRGIAQSFVEACEMYEPDDPRLEAIVIVQLAWQDGITPPVALNNPVSTNLEPWGLREIPADPEIIEELVLDDPTMSEEEKAIPPRVRQWMASLLDLGSRNPRPSAHTQAPHQAAVVHGAAHQLGSWRRNARSIRDMVD
jgi:hypothetical protein